jgi:hypothetical protein
MAASARPVEVRRMWRRFLIDREFGRHYTLAYLDQPGPARIGPAGRGYLRVIYVPDPLPDSVFVVTAYRLGPNALRALRRRRRRRQ